MPPSDLSKRKCPVCKGIPVQHLLFAHPMCYTDGELVVEKTCTRCKPPKPGHDPKDVVGGFHHELIGKVKMKLSRPAPTQEGFFDPGWFAVDDRERARLLVVKPYVKKPLQEDKQQKYAEILRRIKWNHLTPYYIYSEEDGSCPVRKE